MAWARLAVAVTGAAAAGDSGGGCFHDGGSHCRSCRRNGGLWRDLTGVGLGALHCIEIAAPCGCIVGSCGRCFAQLGTFTPAIGGERHRRRLVHGLVVLQLESLLVASPIVAALAAAAVAAVAAIAVARTALARLLAVVIGGLLARGWLVHCGLHGVCGRQELGVGLQVRRVVVLALAWATAASAVASILARRTLAACLLHDGVTTGHVQVLCILRHDLVLAALLTALTTATALVIALALVVTLVIAWFALLIAAFALLAITWAVVARVAAVIALVAITIAVSVAIPIALIATVVAVAAFLPAVGIGAFIALAAAFIAACTTAVAVIAAFVALIALTAAWLAPCRCSRRLRGLHRGGRCHGGRAAKAEEVLQPGEEALLAHHGACGWLHGRAGLRACGIPSLAGRTGFDDRGRCIGQDALDDGGLLIGRLL